MTAAASSTVFPGVTEAFGDYGDYDLNQGIYTVMSYNLRLAGGAAGRPWSVGYGYAGTPMAIDIAVLQAKYGANMENNTGDDTTCSLPPTRPAPSTAASGTPAASTRSAPARRSTS